MRALPYIGITGFKTPDEIGAATASCVGAGFFSDPWLEYVPMFGFIATDNRLRDRAVGGDSSPSLDELPHLLAQTPRGVLSMIHYYTKSKDRTADEIVDIFSHPHGKNGLSLYDAGLCRAVQLNQTWPDPRHLERIKTRFPEMQVVVSLTAKALEDPHLITRARAYSALADYMLVDPSGGQSKDVDLRRAHEVIADIASAMMCDYRRFPLFGVAGGFDGENIWHATKSTEHEELISFFDAQGKLRNEHGIDARKMDLYIRNALDGLRGRI